MKKIFFIHRQSTMFGELKAKFNGQMRACKNLGYDVYFLEWNGNEIDLVQFGTDKRKCMVKTPLIMPMETYYHIVYHSKLYKAAAKVFKTMHFDYVYMRSNLGMPTAKEMVAAVPQDTKFLVEIPTYPVDGEAKLRTGLKFKVAGILSDKYYPYIEKRVDLFTVIGSDVGGEFSGKPAINIQNGTDVDGIPERQPDFDPDHVHLLMLANMNIYHGFDRVIEGLKKTDDKSRFVLHFAGKDIDGSLAKWKNLVDEYHLNDYVIFHGPVYGDNLTALFNQVDLGVSSLGLFRVNMDTGAVLKSREYMTRGLPFIAAAKDNLVPEDYQYNIKIPNDDSAVDFGEVYNFAMKMRADADAPANMRKFADENMSWKSIFQRIFEKVNTL